MRSQPMPESWRLRQRGCISQRERADHRIGDDECTSVDGGRPVSGGAAVTTAHPKRPEPEDGNLIVMGLGLWVVVISLILIISSAIHVHTVRRDLLNHSDALALELAQDISDEGYYAGHALNLRPDPPARGTVVVGEQNVAYTAYVSGEAVVVTLRGAARLPFIPDLLAVPSAVELTVTSSAELIRMP